jgi:arylsulfatase A-like enzyme
LYEPEIRVPLIVHFPGQEFRGKRVQGRARHVDLFSTMLQHGGVPAPAGTDSFSLIDLLNGSDAHDRPVFSELSLDGQNEKSLISGHYKIIHRGKGKPEYELFHLANDPLEKTNIFKQEPLVSGYMKQMLKRWSREQSKKGEAHKSEKAVLDEDTEEMLRGLGYLQ